MYEDVADQPNARGKAELTPGQQEISEIEHNSTKYVDVDYAAVLQTETNWNLTEDQTLSLTSAQDILQHIVEERNAKLKQRRELQRARKKSTMRRLAFWMRKNLGLVFGGITLVLAIAVLGTLSALWVVLYIRKRHPTLPQDDAQDKDDSDKVAKKKGKKHK